MQSQRGKGHSDELAIALPVRLEEGRPWELVVALLVLSVGLLIIGVLYERAEHNRLVAQESQELAAVAKLKASLVQQWIDGRKAVGEATANTLRQHGLSAAAAGDEGARARIEMQLRLLDEGWDLVASGVVDDEGRLIARSSDRMDDAEEWPQWIFGGETRLGSLERGATTSAPDARLALSLPIPLHGAPSPGAHLILEMDGVKFLTPLIAIWPVPSPASETLLVARENGGVTFLSPLRGRPDAKPPYRAGPAVDLVTARAIDAEASVVGADYAGAQVVASAAPIAGTTWFVVAKMGIPAIVGALHTSLAYVAIALVLTFLTVGYLGWHAYQRSRRRLVSAIEDAERRFRVVFDRSADGVLLVDDASRIAALNARARALFEVEAGALEGVTIAKILDEFDAEGDPSLWRDLERRGTISGRRTFRRRDGSTFVGEYTLIRTPYGRYLGTIRDVSERFAEELRIQQARRIAGLGSWECDVRTGKCTWDEQTFLTLGSDPNRDTPTLERMAARARPEEQTLFEQAVGRTLADLSVLDHELRITLPGRGERVVHIVGEVLRSPAGEPLRLVGAVQDSTERRTAESALAGTRLQLAEAQKLEAIGRLAAGVSHDINNIAGVILGNAELAELLLEPGHPARETQTEIRQAALRAGNLTRQLQSFSRRQAPHPQVLSIAATVEDARRLLETVLGSRVRLTVESEPDLVRVRADPTQLTQVLINLAANARDAMPRAGALRILMRNDEVSEAFARDHPPLAAGTAVRVDVVDDGNGMDEETLAHCFEPFFTTKGPGLGTGLGLSTARAIIEAAGGSMEASSEEGQGTRFSFWLGRSADEEAPPEVVVPSVAGQVRGDGELVLVVDDVDAMREVVCNMLAGLGYRTVATASAREALDALARPDCGVELVVTDIVMPETDGCELARRARLLHPGLPILYMTGYAETPPGGRPLDVPAELLLEKPFTTGDLGRRVRRALRRSGDEGDAVEPASGGREG